MELLTLRLLAEERRVEATKRETQETSSSQPAEAFIATHQNRKWNHRGGSHNSNNRGRNQTQQSNWRKRPNVYCDFHNSSTHSSKECRNRPGNKKQKTDHHAKISILESEEQEVDHSFHVTEDSMKSTETTDNWYADSGATRHMSCNQKLFSNLKKVTNSWIVKGIGEKRLYVKGVGDVFFKTHTGGESFTGILKNVLYVPDLGVNLVSIGATTEKKMCKSFFLGMRSYSPRTGDYQLRGRKMPTDYIDWTYQ
jgi:hypothetical protein